MAETTRIITIQITDIYKGDPKQTPDEIKDAIETLLTLGGKRDDLHVKVQDFVREEE